MKPVSSVNDAVRRLLATGGWLDRFPYEETQGKTFRIVTAEGDRLVAANMRFVDMLEKAICEHTGMRTHRERPDVELWVLSRPEASYFLWRMGKRSAVKQDGQLRSDVCAVLAFLAQSGNRNASVLECSGSAIPAALKAAGARAVTCVCPSASAAKAIKLPGVRVCEGSSGYTDLADSSQSAVLLYLPVKSEVSEKQASALRSTLFEARRIMEPEGRLIVLASLAHAQGTLRKTQGIRALARYELTLSGQKSAVWVFCLQNERENEPFDL